MPGKSTSDAKPADSQEKLRKEEHAADTVDMQDALRVGIAQRDSFFASNAWSITKQPQRLFSRIFLWFCRLQACFYFCMTLLAIWFTCHVYEKCDTFSAADWGNWIIYTPFSTSRLMAICICLVSWAVYGLVISFFGAKIHREAEQNKLFGFLFLPVNWPLSLLFFIKAASIMQFEEKQKKN